MELVYNIKLLAVKSVLLVNSYTYSLSSYLAKSIEKDGLHPKHRLMNYHQFFLDNIDEKDTILDIGCGNGALSLDLAKKAKKVIGIDINESNIHIAKNKYMKENIIYYCGDALYNLPDERYDVIILSNVLEHINYRVNFLKSLLDKSNKFLIRVPMIDRSWIDLYKKELGLEYRLDKTHYIEYTLKTFKDETKEAGLKIEYYDIRFGEIWAVVSLAKKC